MTNMTSSKPYLIKAIYDWIVENHLTPYFLISVHGDQIRVPIDYVSKGRIILNASPQAIKELVLGMEAVQFIARFSGKPMSLYIPCENVLAVYTKENGRGMVFQEESEYSEPIRGTEKTQNNNDKRPHLKIVK